MIVTDRVKEKVSSSWDEKSATAVLQKFADLQVDVFSTRAYDHEGLLMDILKLAKGDVAEIDPLIDMAKDDWRDLRSAALQIPLW